MRHGPFVAIAATLALTASTGAAQMTPCGDSVIEYKGAVQALDQSLGVYTQCLNASAGRDDCRIQFQTLQQDQTRFESVVQTLRAECRR